MDEQNVPEILRIRKRPEEISADADAYNFAATLRNRLYTQSYQASPKEALLQQAQKHNFIILPNTQLNKPISKVQELSPPSKKQKLNDPQLQMILQQQQEQLSSRDNLEKTSTALQSVNLRSSSLKPLSSVNIVNEKNSRDPLQFITRLKRSPNNMEFVYLSVANRAPTAPYNPYDLEIIPHSAINKEDYYTMSAAGITHFKNGETDFISLDEWKRESEIFQNILQIPFFKKFRIWKAFYFNKKRIMSEKIQKARSVLLTTLYPQSDALLKQLRVVASISIKISSQYFYRDVTDKAATLEDFVEMQEKQIKDSCTQIKSLIGQIVIAVATACKNFMDSQGFGDKFLDLEKLGEHQTSTKKNTQKKYNTFGAVLQDESYQVSFTEASKKKAACKKLLNFIRKIDFIILDSLIHLVSKSIQLFTEKLRLLHENRLIMKDPENEDDPLSSFVLHSDTTVLPILKTQILLENNHILVVPFEVDFDKYITHVIQAFLGNVNNFERLITRKEFKEYLEPVLSDKGEDIQISEAIDIQQFIQREDSFKQNIADIKDLLHQGFSEVLDYADTFKAVLAMYHENLTLDVDEIRKTDPSVEYYKEQLIKFKEQNSIIDQMKISKSKGIFLADAKKLKDMFAPSPRKCLQALFDLIPTVAKSKNDALFSRIRDAVQRLQTPPTSVEDFVDYLKYISKIASEMESIEEEFRAVSEYYKLIEDERVPIPAEDRDNFLSKTVTKIAELRGNIQLAEDSKEDKIAKFAVDLERKFEDLRNLIKDVAANAKDPMIYTDETPVDKVIGFVQSLKNTCDNVRKKAKTYAGYQEMFKVMPEEVEELDTVSKDVELKLRLWSSLQEWDHVVESYIKLLFQQMDPEELVLTVDKYIAIGLQVQKGLGEHPIVPKLMAKVDEWKVLLPIFSDLKNPSLKPRHWQRIDEVVGRSLSQEPTFELGLLLELNILSKRSQIEEISQTASNETSLEEMLNGIKEHWAKTEFELSVYKEFFVIGVVDDITTLLEDDLITLGTILSSQFVGPIKLQVEEWDRDLRLVSDTLEEWMKCQSKWIYLESVFSSPDIAASDELKDDAKAFVSVDKFFKETMKRTNEGKNVLRATTQKGLFQKFKDYNEILEKIEKSLERYLEKKRNAFPRFYFLSNDDLLDILSQSKNPLAVQRHLEKCFENIKSLEILDGVNIKSMFSKEGEQVPFASTTMKARGAVESWLENVEKNMVDTLKEATKKAVKDYPTMEREQWIMKHYCQVVLTVSQIYWCKQVEDCLRSPKPEQALREFLKLQKSQLGKLAALTRGTLKKLQRKVVCTLIIIDVHARDVIEAMLEEGVSAVTDFGWMKQLRYYWDSELLDCVVRQSNSTFGYGYEYLGCQSRLVITPLTDRVYMTLTGALHLKLGGAPAGPAGTGKTESVKDLAKALAILCIVYNCSDGVTYEMMYKFFSGIVQTGAWACFDEFNRINVEVLSVIASQLQTIQDALKAGLNTFYLEDDKEIRLRHTCGVFITMNPGYAGRTELPDNLKALFRPVAVMIPDYGLISEVILFSEGYEEAKILSRKMVQLYKLSNEQLSSQDHYDFGMRAMKSVLVMAGELKRASPDVPEEITLMRAMRDSNIPKFVKDDVTLFEGIVSDLFPGVPVTDQDHDELESALSEQINMKGLQAVPTFVKKVVQYYDTLVVRHGVMLVGPTGSGKSVCRDLLASTMEYLRTVKNSPNSKYQIIKQFILNPKSITYGELYGLYNLISHAWTDGLIPQFTREAVKDTTDIEKWIVFDGPVDTLWIESMNSVLDDSKLLCLDNTERIQLNEKIHLIFEVQDLAVASPATVSRCGMVYMEPADLGYLPVVRSWMAKSLHSAPEYVRTNLFKHIEDYVPKGLSFVRSHCKEEVSTVDLNLVTSLCDLILALIESDGISFENKTERELEIIVNNLFVFAYVWSLGANILKENRQEFDKFVRDEMKRITAYIPTYGTVFDFYINVRENSFVLWSNMVPQYIYNPDVPYFQIMVPTADTVTYAYFLKTLTRIEKPILFNGKTGVGKSAIIVNTFANAAQDENLKKQLKYELELVTIQFSAQTSSARTQEMIENKLVARKNVLKAPPGKKVALFIDDLNMPELEKFGAQPPIELLRQMLGYKGFYKREEEFVWKEVQDVTVVSACGPPGGGRNVTTPRLLRMFHLFNLPDLSDESLNRIFSSILTGFLSQGFADEVSAASINVVKSAIELYNRVCADFRPTPACSHYTFNLRDLSKVFQGILQTKPDSVKNSKVFVKLWAHESLRCFHDRLINSSDREKFQEMVLDLTKRYFKALSLDNAELAVKNLFGDFQSQVEEERVYEVIPNIDKLPTILDDYLVQYNIKSPSKMDLVFFPDAAKHTARIVRIIRQARGNALLVGVGGSGKQSLTRLAASIGGMEIFEIKLRRGYNLEAFREDLQKIYKVAGVEGKPIVFLLSDSQIVSESFLEDINNILNSGEVPNLFAPEDRERIINELRPIAKEAKVSETRDAIYAFFINRVRDNLHIVLCMSPVGDAFRNRCRMFPSLVNCCTIDWFDEWPDDALRAVAERKLQRINCGSEEVREKLIDMCVVAHSSAVAMCNRYYDELRRKFYITPASYLEFIGYFADVLEVKRIELTRARDNLRKGLAILKKTNEEVEQMQKDLTALQPILAQSTIETEQIIKEVEVATKAANEKRAVISEEEKIVNESTQKAQSLKKDADEKLAQAIPALEKATKALDALDKNSITEIKRYTNPVEAVKLVLAAVCVLFGEKKTDWDQSVKMMSDSSFLTKCQTYDAQSLNPQIVQKLKKNYFTNPEFDEEIVGKKSAALKSLLVWVKAIVGFYETSRIIEPLKEQAAKAKEDVEKMQAALAVKQEELGAVEKQLSELNQKYEEKVAEMNSLKVKTEVSARRLGRAEKLTTSLKDEYNRWTTSVQVLEEQITFVTGNVFLGSAAAIYYGPFDSMYRKDLINVWVEQFKENGIMVGETGIEKVLSNAVQVRDWGIGGLPSDSHSIQNAVLVTYTKRWPLLIDPQGQGNAWIKNMEKKNGLKVVKPTDPAQVLRTLESAIRMGTPVLLEDVGETIDPSLEPLLQKQIYKKHGKFVIVLQSEIDYNPKFKFYMTTKMANPHYLPEICNKVTLINFTVTEKGLEDQLLAEVVRKLERELEEQKDQLVVSVAEDKKMLDELEAQILQSLSSVGDENILDRDDIIKTLDDSKFTANVIANRVETAEKTEIDINISREKYRTVAIRGSILFFVMADLARIDPMYQYSLDYFKKLFNMCIDNTPVDPEIEVLLTNLINNITDTVYNNVCRGLFEKDKLIFSFLICSQILKKKGEITDNEWEFLVRGPILDTNTVPKKPFDWLPLRGWQLLHGLEEDVPNLKGIVETLTVNQADWINYFKSSEPHRQVIPGGYDDKASPFQKLLILKCFREEKVLYASSEFVRNQLGSAFIESPALDLGKALQDTTVATPIIFILSQGADPTDLLKRFAEQSGYKEKLQIKSLGQGQEEVAKRLIEKGKKAGDWVLLQNCHLSVSFMPALETIISEFSNPTAVINSKFRLWLTSMPSPDFPIPILQNSVKLTNEPPKGIRANLLRAYKNLTEEYFESFDETEQFPECPKSLAFKKLLFSQSLFHAIILERKKFGPLGWNIQYEFNDSDSSVAKLWLQMFLKEQDQIPWDSLKYVIGEIVYGGRVTDPWDRRCIMNILKVYLKEEILRENFQFSSNDLYKVPQIGSLAVYTEMVERLPYTDDPELFSMHENANTVFQLQETSRMISTIASIQPRKTGGGASHSDDDTARRIAQKILDELPADLAKEEASRATFSKDEHGMMNSLSTVLSHEMLKYNKLLNRIRFSLRELLKALKGLVVLSSALEQTMNSLLTNVVPELWAEVAYPSLKPLSSWIEDLHGRVHFMRDWLKKGKLNCYWMSGFFFPQGFMTGVLQTFARKYKIPIDTLGFKFRVLNTYNPEEIDRGPEDGVYMYGMFLDGAKWDDNREVLEKADQGQMISKLPVVHFLPEENHKRRADCYEAPLYKTSVRKGVLSSLGQSTNFIIAVELPTKRDPSFFVLQGSALLCENV